MNARLPFLIRFVGVAGLVHAAFGLILGPVSASMAWRLDPSVFDQPQVREALQQELREAPEVARGKDPAHTMGEIREIAASRRFRVVLSLLTTLGVAFNGCLAVLCARFARGRPEGLKIFAVLMAGYFLYSYGLPRVFSSKSGISATVAAAWGVGNMGMGLMLVTYYWLWGTILAAAGAWRTIVLPNNEADRVRDGSPSRRDERDPQRGRVLPAHRL